MYMVYTGRKLSSKSVKWQDIKNRFSNTVCNYLLDIRVHLTHHDLLYSKFINRTMSISIYHLILIGDISERFIYFFIQIANYFLY
jgi:hypothetical protein